ncbi:MAG: EsaB/YukD family protein, partial [Stackebrandtia sp.]
MTEAFMPAPCGSGSVGGVASTIGVVVGAGGGCRAGRVMRAVPIPHLVHIGGVPIYGAAGPAGHDSCHGPREADLISLHAHHPGSNQGVAMPGQYCAVTVVGPEATKKLALPSKVPLSELLAQLLRPNLVPPADAEARPASWLLTSVDGTRLDGGSTLCDAGVHDGDVLHLHDAAEEIIPGVVEDTRDAVEDRVDDAAKQWHAGTGRLFAIGSASVVIGIAAFLPGGQ